MDTQSTGITPYANSLFEQPWWLDIVAPGQWNAIEIKNDKGEVIARMPYVKRGNAVVMPPMTQTLGIWMAPEIKKNYAKQKKVINQIFNELEGKHFDRLRISLSPNNDYVLPLHWRGYKIEPRFTYRLEDLSDIEAVFKGFDKKTRQNIRFAQKNIRISYDLNIEHLWDILNITFSVQGLKYPRSKELVTKVVDTCEATKHGKYVEAVDEKGNVHSCSYFIYDEQACYDMLGGSDNRYNQNSNAHSLVLYEGIKIASGKSVVFDFEGSMIERIEGFYKQFGGMCTPYYSVRKNSAMREIGYILARESSLLRKASNAVLTLRDVFRGRKR